MTAKEVYTVENISTESQKKKKFRLNGQHAYNILCT